MFTLLHAAALLACMLLLELGLMLCPVYKCIEYERLMCTSQPFWMAIVPSRVHLAS